MIHPTLPLPPCLTTLHPALPPCWMTLHPTPPHTPHTSYRFALEARDYVQLGRLMDDNFDLRREMFGDQVLGAHNLRMVGLAR